jgi:hypothetical protein
MTMTSEASNAHISLNMTLEEFYVTIIAHF